MSTTDVELLPTRDLKPGQRTEIWIATVAGDAPELVLTSDDLLLEAPNWAPDGRTLLLNGNGLLWRLNLHPEVTLEQVVIDDLPPINNDHVLDAPRGLIYLSANDGQLYAPRSRAASEQGQPRPHSLPLPPWGQSGRHHAGVRRSAAR